MIYKNIKSVALVALLALLASSCEKIIEIDYKENQSKLVIEANIDDASGPYKVRLSRSLSLADGSDVPTVDGATVIISDDAGHAEQLTALGSGLYQTSGIVGAPGRGYDLSVQVDGQTFTASSTMPKRVTLEGITLEEVSAPGGDIEYNIIPVYTDPIEPGNNYRFVVYLNGKLLNQHFVLDDLVRNGLENTSRLEVNTDDIALQSGDQLTVMMHCVDKNVAQFYRTLALMGDSGPGGGTTPSNPASNISGDVLGLFSAHTAESKTVTIP